jgi:hypothetical protein
MYNSAYVLIENNDSGVIVCNGLYYDWEYENTYVESMIKSSGIGVTMTKKTKRIGCSMLKDLMEENKLKVIDSNTIIECSTFEVSGTSYEATNGNHDDLVMNLVLFGWFTSTPFFNELTNLDIKTLLYSERVRYAEENLTPVGIIDDGSETHYEDPWKL